MSTTATSRLARRHAVASPSSVARPASTPADLERPYRFLFVLENADSGRSYVSNLERFLGDTPWLEATIVKMSPPSSGGFATRWRVTSWSRQHGADGVFLHLKAASLLSPQVLRRAPSVISVDATPRNRERLRAAFHHNQGLWPVLMRRSSFMARNVYSAAAALVAWSHWAADSLITDYGAHPEKVHVIRPGVDLKRFRPLDRFHGDGPVRLLFIGDNFVRKGGPEVLAAIGRLSGRAELDIVSDSEVGPLQADVRCRIHRGIQPDSQDLISLYQGADLLVLPPQDEQFSFSVVEALACGLPVIGPPIGAIPEMVADGVNGLLVPAGQPGQLGRAIEALIESPSLRRAMSAKSLELARKEHDADVNNGLILRVLVEAVASRRLRSAQ